MAGDKIYDLEQKLLYMAETLKELGLCSSVTIDGFAKATNIDRERLRSAVLNGGVSPDLEALLSTSLNFSSSDLTWKDTRIDYVRRTVSSSGRYPGYDTADNFRRMVRLANRLPVLGNLSLRPSRPLISKKNIAALSVSAAQTGIDDANIPILLQVTMNPGFHGSGLTYGFRRVKIHFDFSETTNMRFTKRLGYPKPMEIDGKIITGASNDYDSYWHLTSDGGILRGDFVTGDAPLCELLEAAVGEELTAVLSVCPPDGDLVFANGTTKDVTSSQRAVLKSLMAEKLGGYPNSDGWIILGRQVMTVFRG